MYDLDQAEDEECWGSLPAKLVREYENRIEEIAEDMEVLGVEDLGRTESCSLPSK